MPTWSADENIKIHHQRCRTRKKFRLEKKARVSCQSKIRGIRKASLRGGSTKRDDGAEMNKQVIAKGGWGCETESDKLTLGNRQHRSSNPKAERLPIRTCYQQAIVISMWQSYILYYSRELKRSAVESADNYLVVWFFGITVNLELCTHISANIASSSHHDIQHKLCVNH